LATENMENHQRTFFAFTVGTQSESSAGPDFGLWSDFGLYHFIWSTYLDRRISRFIPGVFISLDERNTAEPASEDLAGKPFSESPSRPSCHRKSMKCMRFCRLHCRKTGTKADLALQTDIFRSQTTWFVIRGVHRRCLYLSIYAGEREFGMQALVVPQIKGETTYQSFIIVPQSSSAKSLLDLRGHVLRLRTSFRRPVGCFLR